MVNFFIERPIFASVLAMILVLAGGICMFLLPIAQFPDISPPQVVVTSAYVGASAGVVADSTTTPIEQQINGVEGMTYMSSVSANDGSSVITVTFDVGYPLSTAAVDVQNRVDRAKPQLPDIVTKSGVVTQKRQPNITLAIALFSPDDSLDQIFISNYAAIQINDALKRVVGVGDTTIFGEKRYSIRIWLDPDKLAKLGLTAIDIQRAVQEQNVQVAAGKIGQAPVNLGQVFEYQINTQGRLQDPAQFGNIIIRTTADGGVVRLRDLARIELGAQDYNSSATYNGKATVGIGVYQLPTANALNMAEAVKAEMERLSKDFPKGLAYGVPYDTTKFVSASIEEVVSTLGEAIILVFAVVYLFLQSWRTTIIPGITIPVSLIGTFALMMLLGFSINTLSLLGMVLAIGLVVDDAIVVVENVDRQLENGLPPLEAAKVAMAEVTGPIIATTAVLMAVFVPVAFIPGISGKLYNQFALTIAVSVAISALNSLTLSPALCAVLLRKDLTNRPWFFRKFNRGFEWLANGYRAAVGRLSRLWVLMLLVFVGLTVVSYFLFLGRPTAFVPQEDQGYILVAIQGPDGAALERTQRVVAAVNQIAKGQDGTQDVFGIAGFNFLSGVAQSNAGVAFITFKPWKERGSADLSATAILGKLQRQFFGIPDALVLAFNAPSIPGLGTVGGFEFQVQDKAGVGIPALGQSARELIQKSRQVPELAGLFSTFTTNVPQLYLEVDRDKAKLLGVSLSDIFTSLQIFLGSLYVNDFNLFGRVYRVILQSEVDFRSKIDDFARIQVRNDQGEMIPLSTFASIRPIAGPSAITHYNLYPSVLINGSAAPGFSSGQAIAAMEKLANETLPRGVGYSWTGVTFQELKSGNTAPLIFGLALVFVFLFLAAQYESWLMPLMVMLAVPLALLGAVGGLAIRNMQMDVFAQIGLVMLIGLAAKNAILIVEFAKRLREEGAEIVEAAMEAARLRLRPILMTAFAFILGVVPLVTATGAGAGSRQSLGTTVFFGMLAGTILSLVFVPVFYIVIEWLREGAWRGGEHHPPPSHPRPATARTHEEMR